MAKAMLSRSGLRMVNTGIGRGNATGNTVASVGNIFRLGIDGLRGTILRVSFVKCRPRRIPLGKHGRLGVVLGRATGRLRRIAIITCNARGGRALAKTVSTMDGSTLIHSPGTDMTGALTNRVAKLSSMRADNRPKRRSPGIFVHNMKSLARDTSSPLVLISNIRHSFCRVSPGRVRDIAMLGSTSTATMFNIQNTGNMVLMAAHHNGRNGTGVSIGSSINVRVPAHVLRVTSDCACTALEGRVVAGSGPGTARGSLMFSGCTIRQFELGSSPVVCPDVS